MKKKLNQLIVEIQTKLGSPRRTPIKLKDLHRFTNKIPVDKAEYNRPTSAQRYVKEEMKDYPLARTVSRPKKSQTKERVRPKVTLEHKIIQLELRLNVLQLEETKAALRTATKRELVESRRRMKKLQRELAFKLCSRAIEPHMAEAVEQFLQELSTILKNTPDVF